MENLYSQSCRSMLQRSTVPSSAISSRRGRVADRGLNFQYPWRRHSVTVAGISPTEVIHTSLLQDSPTGSMHWTRTKASANMLHPVYTSKQ